MGRVGTVHDIVCGAGPRGFGLRRKRAVSQATCDESIGGQPTGASTYSSGHGDHDGGSALLGRVPVSVRDT
jgi:hypothetical protein